MTISPTDHEQRQGVELIFESIDNKRVPILLDRHTRLWSLTRIFATLCDRYRNQIKFSHNGHQLNVDSTADDLKLKDKDVVTVTASPSDGDRSQFMISIILEKLRKVDKKTLILYTEQSELITVMEVDNKSTLSDLFAKYQKVTLRSVKNITRVSGSDFVLGINLEKTLEDLNILEGATIGIKDEETVPKSAAQESDAMDIDDPIIQSSEKPDQDEIVQSSSISQKDSQQNITSYPNIINTSAISADVHSTNTNQSSSAGAKESDGQPNDQGPVPTMADVSKDVNRVTDDTEQSPGIEKGNNTTTTKDLMSQNNEQPTYIGLNRIFDTDVETCDDTSELPPGNQQTGNTDTQHILGSYTLDEPAIENNTSTNRAIIQESQTSVVSVGPVCYAFLMKGPKEFGFLIYEDETFETIFKQYREENSPEGKLAFRYLNNIVSKKDTPLTIGALADKANTIEAVHVELDAIYLQLKGEGSEMYVRTKPHTKLKRAFNYFANKHNLKPESLVATHRGRILSRKDTPMDLGLENGAILEFKSLKKENNG